MHCEITPVLKDVDKKCCFICCMTPLEHSKCNLWLLLEASQLPASHRHGAVLIDWRTMLSSLWGVAVQTLITWRRILRKMASADHTNILSGKQQLGKLVCMFLKWYFGIVLPPGMFQVGSWNPRCLHSTTCSFTCVCTRIPLYPGKYLSWQILDVTFRALWGRCWRTTMRDAFQEQRASQAFTATHFPSFLPAVYLINNFFPSREDESFLALAFWNWVLGEGQERWLFLPQL